MNRDWVSNALGVSLEVMQQKSVDEWIGSVNATLLHDIEQVMKTGDSIYIAEYSLQLADGTGKSPKFVNYQIMPLVGDGIKGVVIVMEDISSEKRAIQTLGRYMSPALAKQVMEEDGNALGGKRKKVAILFSDIRSFTSITEDMEPTDVVELLNSHFSDCVNAILAESGILDKYIGDALMAVFGVPFVTPEDSIKACNAALRMKASLKIANKTRKAAGLKEIRVGMGINTGIVI